MPRFHLPSKRPSALQQSELEEDLIEDVDDTDDLPGLGTGFNTAVKRIKPFGNDIYNKLQREYVKYRNQAKDKTSIGTVLVLTVEYSDESYVWATVRNQSGLRDDQELQKTIVFRKSNAFDFDHTQGVVETGQVVELFEPLLRWNYNEPNVHLCSQYSIVP